jgi:DNA-binding transcriptional LysR family regulator
MPNPAPVKVGEDGPVYAGAACAEMHKIAFSTWKNTQVAMDWSNLRYFLALARSGSLSSASKVLGTDHTTVARRVQALEKELGLQLVDRRARAYGLTPSGQRICELAARVETAIGDVERFAQSVTRTPQGPVRISGPPGLINHWLAPQLSTLQAQFPALRIALVGEAREASLSRREADLALRLFRPREEALVARRLTKVTYGLYGAKDYLSGRLAKDLDFLGHDESEDHLPQHKWLKTIAGDRGFALRANDLSALLGAVRAGLGLAVLPQALARDDKTLRQVPTSIPAPSRDLWLVFHRDVRGVPAIRAVIDHLAAILGGAHR